MVTVDELAALVAFLRADPAVAALCGTRVFGVELPAAEAANMPRAAVVINSGSLASMTMSARSYMRTTATTKDVKCYGATHFQARAVYNAVNDVLTEMRRGVRSGVLLYSAIRTAGPTNLREETVDWPMVFASFEVYAAEEG